MKKQGITDGFEYTGGAKDGENIPYKISNLVIQPNDSLVTGENGKFETCVKVRREHTKITPFSLEDQITL